MENPRTESARAHDDSAIIDAAETAPSQADRSGGKLARDIGTADALARVDDPETTTRATKQDDINNDVAHRNERPRGV